MQKYLRDLLWCFLALFMTTLQTTTAAADELGGAWELENLCNGRRVLIIISILNRAGSYDGTVYYWLWDGERRGDVVKGEYVEANRSSSPDRVVLQPSGRLSPQFVFERRNSAWIGQIHDEACTTRGPFARPRTINSKGEAMSFQPWLGQAPTKIIGSKDLFTFMKLPRDAFLAPKERQANAKWTPVQQVTVMAPRPGWRNGFEEQYLYTSVCGDDSCTLGSMRHFLLDLGGNNRVGTFVSNISGGQFQFCTFHKAERRAFAPPPPAPQWECRRRGGALPATVEPLELTKWIVTEDERIKEEVAKNTIPGETVCEYVPERTGPGPGDSDTRLKCREYPGRLRTPGPIIEPRL